MAEDTAGPPAGPRPAAAVRRDHPGLDRQPGLPRLRAPGRALPPVRASTGGSARAPAAGTRWSAAGPTPGATPSTPSPAAAHFGATGMLVTEWGDNGHLQPPTVMLPALTCAASVAWCRATNEGQDTAAALDALVLPDAAGRAGEALLAAGEVYGRTGVIQPNGSALHDALVGGGLGGFGEPTAEALAGDRGHPERRRRRPGGRRLHRPRRRRHPAGAAPGRGPGPARSFSPGHAPRPARAGPRLPGRRPRLLARGAGRLLERPQPPRWPYRQPRPAAGMMPRPVSVRVRPAG